MHAPRRVRYLSAMREIFRGYLSGNGIRKSPIAGEISPYLAEEGCYIDRFCWSGVGVAVGFRFLLALVEGRRYHIEVEHVVSGTPLVIWFRTTQR